MKLAPCWQKSTTWNEQAISHDERYQLCSRCLPYLYQSFSEGDSDNLVGNAGLTNQEIMAISGHRNESSLQSYHNVPCANQLRKCSEVLTAAIGDDERYRHLTSPRISLSDVLYYKMSTWTTAISECQHNIDSGSPEHSCIQLDVQCCSRKCAYHFQPMTIFSFFTK